MRIFSAHIMVGKWPAKVDKIGGSQGRRSEGEDTLVGAGDIGSFCEQISGFGGKSAISGLEMRERN